MSIYVLKDRTIRFYTKIDTKPQSAFEKSFNSSSLTDLSSLQTNINAPQNPNYVGDFLPKFNPQVIKINIEERKNLVVLKEVESIKFNYKVGLGIETGLSVAFLQPWYIEPISISISGRSYMGMYDDISNEDHNVEDTISLLNKHFVEKSGTKDEITLEIVNNPKDTNKFNGYIRDFNFEENLSKPYIFNYQIEFIGKSDVSGSSSEAKTNSTNDNIRVTRKGPR